MIRTILLCMLGIATVATALTAGDPAYADDEHIGLSHDGRTWQPSLRAPVFDPDRRWVPGEIDRKSFYIRNEGPTTARLTVDVVAGGRLVDDIRLRGRVAGAAWHSLRNGSPSATLTREVLDRDSVTRVDLAIRYRWEASNATQHSSVPLEFVVHLEHAGPTEDGDGGGAGEDTPDDSTENEADDGAGTLPGAGSAVPAWLLWLAAMLIGAGLALGLAWHRERGRHG